MRTILLSTVIILAAGAATAATMSNADKTRYRDACLAAAAGRGVSADENASFCGCTLEKIQVALAPLPASATGSQTPLPDTTLADIMAQCERRE